jgi:hypothetical protein
MGNAIIHQIEPNRELGTGPDLARLRNAVLDLEIAINDATIDTVVDMDRLSELYRHLRNTRAALRRWELRPVPVTR